MTDTFWCTRDENSEGVLSELVDVWLARPVRMSLPGGGCMWLGPGDTGLEERYAQWTIAVTLANCCTYPETSRESICKG
jgi:hypothetical protein